MTVPAALADEIADVILDARPFTYTTEASLQRELAAALSEAGYDVAAEVTLSDGASRIDFLVDGVGIEVKIQGGWVDVARQLVRYGHCDEIRALMLVTTRAAHTKVLRADTAGVPLRVVSLLGGGL